MKKTQERVELEIDKKIQQGKLVVQNEDTDPIKNIRKRIEDLDSEWLRVNHLVIETDDDNNYSRGWEQKKKDLRSIEKLIQQNTFALNILITLNTRKNAN